MPKATKRGKKKPIRKSKKIAILGTTPSRGAAPLDDPEWEIWTIGPGGKDTHRWDRLFEVHGTWPENFKGYLNDLSLVKPPQQVMTLVPIDEAIAEWADKHDKSEDDVKKDITGDWSAHVLYPKDKILAKYQRRMWFSSSIAYCIALAIEEGATDIGCWGIDLESGEEYISQFVGCAHLLDLARLIGINIHLPEGCGLMRDPAPYPDRYETHLALTMEKKKAWLETAVGEMEPQREGLTYEVYRLEGEIITLQKYDAPQELIVEKEQTMISINNRLGVITANINQLKGELAATDFYRKLYVTGLHDPNDYIS